MPVFCNRDRRRRADAANVVELQDCLEELQSTLKKYRRFHTADLMEYLDDVETQLLLDSTVEELDDLNEKVELMEERLEEIEDLYDVEDFDDHDSIREELEDLLEDLGDLDFNDDI